MAEITCIGNILVDIIGGPLDVFPNPGQSTRIKKLNICAGGCGANTAVALARLGVSTRVVSKVGQDMFGEYLKRLLASEKVIIDGISESQDFHTSGTMVIVNSTGERTFIYYPGTNEIFTIKDIDFNLLNDSKVIHIAGTFAMDSFDGLQTTQALKRFKQMGKITSLDTSWDPTGRWLEVIEESLPYIDIFMPSLNEAKKLSGFEDPGKIGEHFRIQYGIPTVIIKLGQQGSYAVSGDERLFMPSFEVECIDTTGAGDSFVAGFLAAKLRGFDLKTSLKVANAAGALCVEKVGHVET